MSVGALITWPYKAGGRSRRGSPKAGTTVNENATQGHLHLEIKFYIKVIQPKRLLTISCDTT